MFTVHCTSGYRERQRDGGCMQTGRLFSPLEKRIENPYPLFPCLELRLCPQGNFG